MGVRYASPNRTSEGNAGTRHGATTIHLRQMAVSLAQTCRMWTTFVADLLVAVFGAGLTVLIAFWTYRHQQKVTERVELSRLINDLHHRRVLHEILNPRLVYRAKEIDDFKHANLSVLDIRDQTKRVGHQLRPGSPAQEPVSGLIKACNRYLEEGMYRPEKYHFHLQELRNEVQARINEIAAGDQKIKPLEAGGSVY